MKKVLQLVKEYQESGVSSSVNYDRYNEYFLTYHSTAIEGSTLSQVQTELLLDEGIVPQGKPLEHINMVIDHHEALKIVLNNKSTPVSMEYIQEINAKVLRRTGAVYFTAFGNIDSSRGEFRRGTVFAGKHTFPSYNKIPNLLNKLVGDLNNKTIQSQEQALQLSFYAHYSLVSIHPFYDGNGRTSRLLMNHLQNQNNLPLLILKAEDKAEYIEALIKAREKEDIKYFTDFMLNSYRVQLKKELNLFRGQEEMPKIPKIPKGGLL